MNISGTHIVIVVYGVLDERSKKTATWLSRAGARVTIMPITHSRETITDAPYALRYCEPESPKGSEIPARYLRIAVNIFNRVKNLEAEKQAGIFAINRVKTMLAELKPDIVHAINADTLAAVAEYAAQVQIPFVYEAYEFWPDHARSAELKTNEAARTARLEAEQNNVNQAAAMICVSPYLADEYQKTYALKATPLTIYNAPTHVAAQVSDLHEPLRLLFLGNLQPERNISLLLDAMTRLDNVELSFQGKGSMEGEIREFARRHGLEGRIHINPPVPYEQVPESASEHDIGLICHIAYDRQMQGALPNKFFEYLSGGLAVLCSNTEAFAQFPHISDFAELFDPTKSDSFVAACEKLSQDKTRLLAMKRAAHQAAQGYIADAQAAQLLELYATLEGEA